MANVQDYDVVVSKFERQSRYYVHFQTHILEKGLNSCIPHSLGYIVSELPFYDADLDLGNPWRLLGHKSMN